MIGFATLFLGLLLGPHDVELLVDERVARVELVLDGEIVATLDAPPFRVEVDFGEALEPHHLEAVAYDQADQEVARSDQWINLPRAPAEVTIVLESDGEGVPRRVKVAWNALAYEEPDRIQVSMDGRLLEVDDPQSFDLPDYDSNRLHLLRVEVDFDAVVSASQEVTFGGFYADSVNSEITAVAIDLGDLGEDRSLPKPGERSARFLVRGQPAVVAGIEKGPAEVMFIRDVNMKDSLEELWRKVGRSVPISLEKDHRLRVLWATPQMREIGDARHALFPRSGDLQASDGELYWYLSRLMWPESAANQKVADAVAVGGMAAAARNRRRAVVLMLGPWSDDVARLEPEQVRGYLSALRVPLYVWSTHPEEWQGDLSGWGEIEDISSMWKLARATRRLRKSLNSQRIVWLEGEYLPQQIAVTGAGEPPGN